MANKDLIFGAMKTGKKLDHFIWSCTRAYPVKHAFSLGDGKPLSNELTTDEAKIMLRKVADFGADNLFISGAGWTLSGKGMCLLEISPRAVQRRPKSFS